MPSHRFRPHPVLFPHRGYPARRPGIGWRRTVQVWWLLFLAVAVAWLGGFLWPVLAERLSGR